MTGIAELITSKEFILSVSSAVAAIAGIAVKTFNEVQKAIEKRETESRERIVEHEQKAIDREATFRKDISQSIKRMIVSHTDRANSEYNQVRASQINFAEEKLHEYAVCITMTSGSAAKAMVCREDCSTVDDISELWAYAVHKTITKNVLIYIIGLINKNGFRKFPAEQFEEFISRETVSVFDCFLNSMRAYFKTENIRIRIDWIESKMDRGFMRQTVSRILHECRDLSMGYHEVRTTAEGALERSIEKEVIVTKAGV